MNKLILQLKEPEITKEALSTLNSIAWAEIKLILRFDSNSNELCLLSHQWDADHLAEWYIENATSIWNKTLPQIFNQESLACALKRLQNFEFTEKQEDLEFAWHETLYQFRRSHSLRFALRGANIPEIILGKKNEHGEISRCDEKEDWHYEFSIDEFIGSSTDNLVKFLTKRRQELGSNLRLEHLINALKH